MMRLAGYQAGRRALRATLKQAHDEGFSAVIARIKANVTKAVDVLVDLLESEDNQIRIRTAENVIEYAMRLNHNDELEKRINDLEERLNENATMVTA